MSRAEGEAASRRPAPGGFPRAAQALLAAGRSSRMGRPKALLDFDGRTALELALEAARGGGAALSAVVLGAGDEAVRRSGILAAPPLPVRAVFNPDPASDQLRSIQLALEALAGEGCDAFFIQPCDFPLVTGADYRLLLDAFRADRGASRVYVPSHASRRGHPVLCAAALAAEFLALGQGGTARDVLARGPVKYVLTDNAGVLEDMDTPEDYARLLALYRASRWIP